MINNLQAKLEALLFVYGEPVKTKKLAEVLDVDEAVVLETLKNFGEKLKEEDRGLSLVVLNNQVQLTTKPELGLLVQKIIKEELDSDLSPASLETLSIIAYLGPCSRAEIEYIRGVNSSFILRSLAIRGLIEKQSNPKRPNAYLYQITFDFLKHIGINHPEELPDYQKYRDLVKLFKDENESVKTQS